MARGLCRFLMACLLAVSAAGCARELGGDTVDGRSVSGAVPTERGVVESVRRVQVVEGESLSDNAFGFGVGALAGGFGGSFIGGGRGTTLAAGAGAVLGGLLGAAVEREASRGAALEYVVRLPFDRRMTVVQDDAAAIPVGAPVYLISGRGQRARIAPVG
ncbi:hypothetical protein [Rubrimonas cliftonensis]|uniref:Outer membrane lipoprotein SlyB n=1 Tax=Rubrimonas cliftonensis TaxID=89524 RepID=A0A1H4DKM6_9RHOB|nr:hypothetical protein [Rubrimonas cliftonensis]SEA73331.1 outer membrane lipoprotein SlyB [Rubrimonas cliftonensis]